MRWAPPYKSLTTRQREDLYERERGDKEFPLCNLCGRPVRPHDTWEPSHIDGKPRAFNGTEVGVAHKRCNRKHGYEVVIPQVALAKKKYKWARGIKVSRNPVRGGKESAWKRRFDGAVVDRVTGKPWGSTND